MLKNLLHWLIKVWVSGDREAYAETRRDTHDMLPVVLEVSNAHIGKAD